MSTDSLVLQDDSQAEELSGVFQQLSSASSIDEISDCLSTLSEFANSSLAHAFTAQIQVLKYISSPDLYGSAFDLFFKNIDQALSTSSEEERSYIKEKASLMLNNLIFFTKAKLEWEIEDNRKEAAKLFNDAAKELSESIADLAISQYTGVNPRLMKQQIKAKLIENFTTTDEETGTSIFGKAIKWITKGFRLMRKNIEFYQMLDVLGKKLLSNHDIIGNNNLISGIFENYRDKLIEYHESQEVKPLLDIVEDQDKKSKRVTLIVFILGLVIQLIVFIIRWICTIFTDLPHNWAGKQWMWFGIIIVSISLVIFIYHQIQARTYLNKAMTKKNQLENYYDNLIMTFRE